MDNVELTTIATQVREDIIRMLTAAGSGHSAGPMGITDVLVALYFGGGLNYRATEPEWEERDRLILSAGHLVPALYAVLARAGFFPVEELDTLRRLGSRLQGHPHRGAMNKQQLTINNKQLRVISNLPGIEVPAGPLGQGVSVAVGRAIALRASYKLQATSYKHGRLPKVICIGSDGEMQEGQVWEALMAAAKYKLDNLTYIIDRNHIQISGFTEQVMPLEPLKAKLEAFGWFAIEVDGHNYRSILDALAFDTSIHGKPVAMIAYTVPGKGVSFMEENPEWHGRVTMGPGEAAESLKQLHELRTLQGKIIGEHE